MYNRSEIPVYPVPKKLARKAGRLELSPFTEYRMTWAVPAEQDGDPALEQTRADLEELLAARFPLTAAQPTDIGLTVEVRLGAPEDIAGAEVPAELADQAYRIEISVKPARVRLTGYGIPGLGYAVVSSRLRRGLVAPTAAHG